jgi:hypothetical protein
MKKILLQSWFFYDTNKISAKNEYFFGNNPIFLEGIKFQQILEKHDWSFKVCPFVLIVGQPKNLKTGETSMQAPIQIPEFAGILIISRKIPALRALSAPKTCLELSFWVFPLVLIFGRPKKAGNSEKEQTSVNTSGMN